MPTWLSWVHHKQPGCWLAVATAALCATQPVSQLKHQWLGRSPSPLISLPPTHLPLLCLPPQLCAASLGTLAAAWAAAPTLLAKWAARAARAGGRGPQVRGVSWRLVASGWEHAAMPGWRGLMPWNSRDHHPQGKPLRGPCHMHAACPLNPADLPPSPSPTPPTCRQEGPAHGVPQLRVPPDAAVAVRPSGPSHAVQRLRRALQEGPAPQLLAHPGRNGAAAGECRASLLQGGRAPAGTSTWLVHTALPCPPACLHTRRFAS